MLGAIVEGMPLQGGKYLGGAFAWFSPFSMLTGGRGRVRLCLLGSTWLIMKTEGALQNVAFALTRPLVAVVVAFMGLVSTWLPFLSSRSWRAGSKAAISCGCRRCRCWRWSNAVCCGAQ